METTLQERIAKVLAFGEIEAKPLSVLAGLSPTHVGQFVRGDVGSMDRKTAERLSRVTGITCAWLSYGEGPDPTADAVRAAVEAARAAKAPATDPADPSPYAKSPPAADDGGSPYAKKSTEAA
jgi:hypothetical protein